MANGVRANPHLNKNGQPKIGYSAQGARDEMQRIYDAALTGPDTLRIYPCKTCGKYHVGHRTARYTSHRRRRRGAW